MKKSFLLLMAFLTMSANMLADGLTATLQQGDKMTAYFGADAYLQAYEAASDGAIITLSAGQFNYSVEGMVTKQITIIGANAYISKENTEFDHFQIEADNVHLEGVYISGTLFLGLSEPVSNCSVKRCWIEGSLTAFKTHTNTLIDQCVIKQEKANEHGVNYTIKNSTIRSFCEKNTIDNMMKITNCVVWNWVGSSACQPYAIYTNNILATERTGNISYETDSNSEFYHNLFITFDASSRFYVTFPSGIDGGNITGKRYDSYYGYYGYEDRSKYPAPKPYKTIENAGLDGTYIGTYGGTGFSIYPGIPRIISRTIDSFTDADGKLNVKIEAKAEP